MLIKNYGLRWHRDRVWWGAPGRAAGTLLGRSSKRTSSKPVDFRDQRGIYVLMEDRDVVYVGQAGHGKTDRLFHRLRKHRSDELADRWDSFSWFGLRRVLKSGGLSTETPAKTVSSENVLNHLEAILIVVTEPPLNKQGGRWRGADLYAQELDESLDEVDPLEELAFIADTVEGLAEQMAALQDRLLTQK